MTYYDILFSFFIYGFLGWCSEVAFAAFKQHSFVNRGFLNGPICPIYGIGVTVVVASLQPYVGNLILLYITSTILVTFLEWLTGFLLEKMFHHRWWDYSEMPLNIGGYVCPLFSAIWGVSDEDSYAKAIRTLGQRARSGRPFFAHIMSVSNHRPYTYPAGRIPIPNDAKSRAGGVMYSDYALGGFLDAASREPWFDNTVFVITADHCASSAGKTEIPLEKYHIPAMIYAPAFVAPGSVGKTASQIDLMPTLFSLLGMDYDSWFYGRDILADDFRERAFVATYQDLGYLEGDRFTVLSPVDRAEQFLLRPTDDDPYALERTEAIDSTHLNRAISLYQTSSQWNKR